MCTDISSRGHLGDKPAHTEMSISLTMMGMHNKTTPKYDLTTRRMVPIEQ